MAVQHHVRNPMEWGWDRLKETGQAIGSAASTMDGAWEAREMAPPVVRKIGLDDLRQALREGARDFGACRTDVVFLCMIYPIAGLIISRFAFDYGMLPLIFPLVSGFALIAPALRRRPLRDEPPARARHRHRLGRRLRRRALAGDRLGHGAGPRPDRPVRAVARRRLFHLHGDARSRSACLGHCLRTRRGDHAAGLDDGRRGHRRRLPVRPAGAGDQRRLLPAAARPQCRRAPGGGDLVPRRAREPRADGRVGPDHRRRPGDRRDPAAGRPRHHPAHPRARDVAPLSQGGSS